MTKRTAAPLLLLLASAFAQDADPAAQARRAHTLAVSGKLTESIAIYRSLIQQTPRNATLLLNLAIVEYQARQYEAASSTAESALAIDPSLLPAKLFHGASRLELGDYASAVRSLTAVTAATPRDRNARLMLGESLVETGAFSDAIPHLQFATQALPENPRAWFALGRAMEGQSDSAHAAEAWARLEALPPSLQLHLHRAQIHDREERWRESAVEWQAALRFDPGNGRLRLGHAWALYRCHDYQAAIAALDGPPPQQSADAQFLRGASLLNLQQPAAAIPILRTAISASPDHTAAKAALGQALLQTGKPLEAISFLKDGLSGDTDGTLHFQLFRAYQLTGQDAEARVALNAYRSKRRPAAQNP